MYKINRIIFLSVFSIFLGNCGDSEIESESGPISSPPSITQTENSVQMVRLSPEQSSELNVRVFEVKIDTITFNIIAPATVFPAPENISIVSAPISGRISDIFAHEGEFVSKGDPLLEIESLDYANLLADFLEDKAELDYLKSQLERDQQLVDREITSQRTFERTTADFKRAESKFNASKARLNAIGISNNTLQSWENGDLRPPSSLALYAPISGKLNEHLIDLGTSVEIHQKLLDIVDARKVLVRSFVSPDDASFIKPGTEVIITDRLSNNGIHLIKAAVRTINPTLDEINRAIPVNIIVEAENQWPIIGQNVQTTFSIIADDIGTVIPLSAVQFEQEGAMVFVQIDSNVYEKRAVVTGRMSEDEVVIISGLTEGESVAISQIFNLKALVKFEEFAE